MYRSGDQARFLADGNVEFLGRNDGQVKIRGFRIELGEIEALLREAESVREAIVAALETDAGGPRLVAYVVTTGNAALNETELKAALKSRLPAYMFPAQFVQLAAMPLTPHGKVDRRALPAPDPARSLPASSFVAPRTQVESTLAGVWAKVLGVAQVSAEDDFFELGGHSLLAAQVVVRVRAIYQTDFSLGDFLRAPTIAGLATAIEERLLAEVSRLSEEEVRSQVSGAG